MIGKWKETEIGRIPEDWGFDTLGSNLIIKGRIGWKGLKKSEYVEQGYAIINGEQIINDSIDWNSCGRITKGRYDESPEIMLRESDILMTKDGTIGKLAYINEMKEPTTVASGIFVIRNNSTKLDQKYLYYVFKSIYFKNLVESRIEGSVVPHLYQRDIVELKIPFPPLQEQRKIAEVFLSLDDKIALNRSMNSTLEAIAQALFRRWFIDFEFPDGEGKPYRSSGGEMVETELGEVPVGWRVGTIGEILELAYGKALKDDNRQQGNVPVYGSNGQIGWHDEKLADGPGIVVGRKGNPGIVTWSHTAFFPIDTTFYVVPKSIIRSMYYLFYILRLQDLPSLGADSAVPGLNRNIVYMNKMLVPSLKTLKLFDTHIKELFNKIQANNEQSRTLVAIRDALLPKLMSGEIKVR